MAVKLVDDKEKYQEWKKLINMTAGEIIDFMGTKDGAAAGLTRKKAKELGIKSGQESARWIVRMKKTPYRDWGKKENEWMRRQIGFVKRFLGIKKPYRLPDGSPTRLLLALKIWGHNPEKKRRR